MPAISVIMLTYNREKLVERAVRSILGQTFQEYELIILDNGSTDGSGEICERIGKEDKRISVIHLEKRNIGSGRNAGLDIAKGRYVTFIDDDDYCMEDFLQFLYETAERTKADIVTCGSYKEENGRIVPNGNYVYDTLYEMNAQQAVEKYLWRQLYNCAMPTKLVRRELCEAIRFPESGTYDDITTTYKYFANAAKTVSHGLPKYVFYRHEGNNSSAATKFYLLNETQLNEYLCAFRERTAYISRILPGLEGLARYSEWSYMISMIDKIKRFHVENCEKVIRYMQEQIMENLEEFENGGYIQNFEKEWIKQYITNAKIEFKESIINGKQ